MFCNYALYACNCTEEMSQQRFGCNFLTLANFRVNFFSINHVHGRRLITHKDTNIYLQRQSSSVLTWCRRTGFSIGRLREHHKQTK